ncbi:cupin-like domain-containing protein [Alteromonas sp. D210916BOD_24]|uniref:cupin-like domain-containing protein n=1 Tax=Alteromonas sp. D210916BOD_24 TaxID=3157618 RepID=UPI00399C668A
MNSPLWRPIEERFDVHLDTDLPTIVTEGKPVVLRGLIASWPSVQDACDTQALMTRLKDHYNGQPTMIYQAERNVKGRYAYTEDISSLNYQSVRGNVAEMLDEILATLDKPDAPSRYVASNQLHTHFPGFLDSNSLTLPQSVLAPDNSPPLASIWIGNHSIACAHFDALENIACCVAGRRQFNLFPPNQVANLYPGPLHLTPGGQPVTLVDIHDPDLSRFPRYKVAQQHGYQTELQPGDAIYIPTMWWHQVEGLSAFNVMVNYWWNQSPRYQASGMNALFHGLLAIRDKSAAEKAAWRALFDYYIFSDDDSCREHIPLHAQGPLAPLDENMARQLRALLLRQLNR